MRAGSTSSSDPATEEWVILAGSSMSDSTAPRDSARVNNSRAGGDPHGCGLPAFEGERDHGAEVAHLAGGELVARMARETRVVDLGHGRVVAEVLGDNPGALALAVEADGEGLEPALHEVAVERARHRSGRVLDETEVPRELVVVCDHEAAHDVGVPAQVLSRGVDDGVGSESYGLLQVGRGEGVVDDAARPVGMRRDRHGLDVDHVQLRVARRLQPHKAGLAPARPRRGHRGRAARRA